MPHETRNAPTASIAVGRGLKDGTVKQMKRSGPGVSSSGCSAFGGISSISSQGCSRNLQHLALLQVTINGVQVVDADVSQYPQLRDLPRRGAIGLYNWRGHANGVAFRNISLQEL